MTYDQPTQRFRFSIYLSLSLSLSLLFLLTAANITAGAPQARIWRAANPVNGEYIVVLADQSTREIDETVESLARSHGGFVIAKLRNGVKAFGVRMTEKQATTLSQHPLVDHIEENGRVFLSANQYMSDDTLWHLDRINTDSAGIFALDRLYSYTNDGAGVNVYVMDTGVLGSHQDFGGRVRPGITIADGNPANWPCGVDVFTSNSDPAHGTRVASIVGGTANGVAKGVTIIPVKVWTCELVAGQYGIGSSILWWCWALDRILEDAVSQENCPGGVCRRAVVNISGGHHVPSVEFQICRTSPDPGAGNTNCLSAFENNIVQAVRNGIVVVAAANNQNNNFCNTTPARLGHGGTPGISIGEGDHVITVGGSTDVSPTGSGAAEQRWVRRPDEYLKPGDAGSNYGTCVDIYAPAEHFRRMANMASTTSIEMNVPYQSGTSYAAPIVSGLAARLLQQQPTLTPLEVWQNIRDAALAASNPSCFDPDAGATPCNNSKFIFANPSW